VHLNAGKYHAISFDCYGTLIDWDTGVSRFIDAWAHRCGIVLPDNTALQAFAQAQYRHQRSLPHKNYRTVLRDAFADMADVLNTTVDQATLDEFARSAGTWPPFPDTLAALRTLKARSCHLAVVSNVDTASFAETHKRLGGLIDTVVTAEDVEAYKPDLIMFDTLFASLRAKGISRQHILHVAQSKFHDVAPANALGLEVVWISRQRTPTQSGITMPSDAEPAARFDSLESFAQAFRHS